MALECYTCTSLPVRSVKKDCVDDPKNQTSFVVECSPEVYSAGAKCYTGSGKLKNTFIIPTVQDMKNF